MWRCAKCRGEVEDQFDTCWNCGTSREGVVDPSFRPEPVESAPPAPHTPEVDGPTRSLRQHLPWVVLGAIACAALLWVVTRPEPQEQFKEISDPKKVRLTEFLAAKGSRLHEFKATVHPQADVEKWEESPYVGNIEFSYTVSRSEGVSGTQRLETAVAIYRYSKKGRKWVYEGCAILRPGHLKDQKPLVNFEEIKEAVFEQ
jgi:hypothetical protein